MRSGGDAAPHGRLESAAVGVGEDAWLPRRSQTRARTPVLWLGAALRARSRNVPCCAAATRAPGSAAKRPRQQPRVPAGSCQSGRARWPPRLRAAATPRRFRLGAHAADARGAAKVAAAGRRSAVRALRRCCASRTALAALARAPPSVRAWCSYARPRCARVCAPPQPRLAPRCSCMERSRFAGTRRRRGVGAERAGAALAHRSCDDARGGVLRAVAGQAGWRA